jgi:hypothetical protein
MVNLMSSSILWLYYLFWSAATIAYQNSFLLNNKRCIEASFTFLIDGLLCLELCQARLQLLLGTSLSKFSTSSLASNEYYVSKLNMHILSSVIHLQIEPSSRFQQLSFLHICNVIFQY